MMKKLLMVLLSGILALSFFAYRNSGGSDIRSKPDAQNLSSFAVMLLKISYFVKNDAVAAFRLTEYYWADDMVESCIWFKRAQNSGYTFIDNELNFYTSICPKSNK